MPIVICQNPDCHKNFTADTKARKYCSHACYGVSRRTSVSMICQNVLCGKTFITDREGRKFCCHKCFTDARISSDEERFWKFVEKTTGCWIWNGHRNKQNYGSFTPTQTFEKLLPMGAHRFSYILAYGAIEEGMVICHHCDNPPCVRPDHLFIGTQKDNINDAVTKNRMRHLYGKDNARGRAKLTIEDVKKILSLKGKMRNIDIAKMFNISDSIIANIYARRIWWYVEED